MPDDALHARSHSECRLFIRATACPACGRGPLRPAGSVDNAGPGPGAGASTNPEVVSIDTVCGACHAQRTWAFRVDAGRGPTAEGLEIGGSPRPSRMIDVGQWMVLSRLLIAEAERETDRVRARNLRIEAGACLDEAVRFYDDPDNDLPPASSIFTEATRQRFRQAPEQFSRQRLIEARAKLPTAYPGGRTRDGDRA